MGSLCDPLILFYTYTNYHIKRRHTEYNCDQCDNWYKCRKELEDHIKRRHKEYNCDQCEDKYESREKLEVHRKFKHIKNTTKNFCFCRKGFNTKEELFEHSYIEHCYVCVNCDNEYNNEEDLEDHIRKKHSQECEEKMECRNKKEGRKERRE